MYPTRKRRKNILKTPPRLVMRQIPLDAGFAYAHPDTHLACTATAPVIKAAGYEFVGSYYRMPESALTSLKTAEAAALKPA
jgi:hypothetical protein